MQPTVLVIYVNWKYMLVLDISCQPLRDEFKLENFEGRRVWKYTILRKHISGIYMLEWDTSCKQLTLNPDFQGIYKTQFFFQFSFLPRTPVQWVWMFVSFQLALENGLDDTKITWWASIWQPSSQVKVTSVNLLSSAIGNWNLPFFG